MVFNQSWLGWGETETGACDERSCTHDRAIPHHLLRTALAAHRFVAAAGDPDRCDHELAASEHLGMAVILDVEIRRLH